MKLLPGFITARPKLTIILIVIIAFIYVIAITIPDMAKTRVITMLEKSGFQQVSVDKIHLRPASIRAANIKLDPSGLDTIETLDIDLNWVSFLLGGKINGLDIKNANISTEMNEASSASHKLLQSLLSVSNFRLDLSNITIDISTLFGDLRMRLDATVDKGKETSTRSIKAKLTADQYQLSFSSEWEGTVDKNGVLDLTGNVLDGRMNMGPLRISRFNGWLGVGFNNKDYTAQGQLEAGSATFMKIPLQNISFVNQVTPAQSLISIRSGISGMPDVRFAADLTKNDKQESFAAILKGKNLAALLSHMDNVTQKKRTISPNLLNHHDFDLEATYQPDRRFVGGPLPFSITLNADDGEIMEGNALLYMDTMDIRGSLETDVETATALQDYFKIPSENIKQNFIRLDSDMKKLFVSEEKPAKPEAN